MAEPTMLEPIIAWQCLGCGKLDAPQPCIGVCEDRKVELLPAQQYRDAIAQCDQARHALAQWHNLAHRLLQTTPHDDAWQESYRVFQAQMAALLRQQDGS
ncbi:MAG: hypothetical protein COW59_01450 [Lysobacterales bacterium CG17_big_fil_post_rev_8_21_14_2_50_64_11]|nr:MAG: hypothetical protein COW59_01450 [Xanthomonadales bacterium CG17_big_fil_post_rev_8_21_14_2_50_64_11]PIX59638.1 MAG: hypothetical protein COZ47_11410 [Xanthomonadales bacterium CG_4_10_14_3_um_filter_64_11]